MHRGRRTDDVVAGAVGAAMLASLGAASWIAFRGWDAVLRLVTHPLSLTETQALWAGLLSSDLFVVQALLLARLPWLERSWGRGRLTWLHRQAAYWSFWLLVLHVLLFMLQRASREPDRVGGALVDLFLHERHLLVATIGTALIVVVILTSVVVARRVLRYETWHLVHLWSYVGLGLAFPHQLTSVDFGSAGVRAYWWTLYLGALAVLVTFRVLLPLARSVRHRLVVTDVVEEAPGVVSVVVGGRDVAGLGVRSGQFLVWRFGGRGRTRGHPYSVSRAPGDTLRVTVGGAGDGTRDLAAVRVGAPVAVEGPYGHLAPLRRRHPHLLLVAAGVGITPFRALLESEPFAPGEVTLVQRSRDAVLFAEEIDELAAARGVRVVRLVGPRRTPYSFLPVGHDGEAVAELLALAPHLLSSDVYLCGPPEWMATVRRVARAAGVARRDVHQEDFGW